MAVRITGVESGSFADKAGLLADEYLVSINGNDINDILDYRFYETNRTVELLLRGNSGKEHTVTIKKPQYSSLGLEFATYLMDEKHTCRNKCIFCFIDQMPPNMRETLYFKDDDSRLSFLFGNYITLTNLKESDVQRIINMHISPINISVHTTNPELRVKMMKNRFAGEVLSILPRLANAGIRLNCQLVLCPGINDGDELVRTLSDLEKLMPNLESVAVVPLGLTKFRDGLEKLTMYDKKGAGEVIDTVNSFGDRLEKEYGQRVMYPADEFYLKAERPIPPPEYYGAFSQLEDGVGGMACLKEELGFAMEDAEDAGNLSCPERRITIATGKAAESFMNGLLDEIIEKCDNLEYRVVGINNDFFGETITVAGLVTGQDLIAQLSGIDLGDELLIPSVMLRHDGDLFLDDISITDAEKKLNIKIRTVNNDGYDLLNAVLGR